MLNLEIWLFSLLKFPLQILRYHIENPGSSSGCWTFLRRFQTNTKDALKHCDFYHQILQYFDESVIYCAVLSFKFYFQFDPDKAVLGIKEVPHTFAERRGVDFKTMFRLYGSNHFETVFVTDRSLFTLVSKHFGARNGTVPLRWK